MQVTLTGAATCAQVAALRHRSRMLGASWHEPVPRLAQAGASSCPIQSFLDGQTHTDTAGTRRLDV